MSGQRKKGSGCFAASILFRLYSIKRLRPLVLRLVKKMEGGEEYSQTLRRIATSYHNITIGMYSYGSCFSFQSIPPGTTIGRYCSFAPGVSIFNGNHPMERKSMHPFFYNPKYQYVDRDMIPRSTITFGNDVWIGFNAIILPSVKRIGDGAVIGAGSVVTKDVPDFAIVAGNPAKIIRYRFPEERIREIINTAWWNKDIEEICQEEFAGFMLPVQ